VNAGPIEAGDSKQFRAARRLGRWLVGQAFQGEIKPDGAPCTIVFPDLVGSEVEAWLADMKLELQKNRALVGLPILSWIYAGQTVDHRAFAVLPPIVGRALDAHVMKHGPMEPVAALQIAVMLADAIGRLHSRGRVLGELRPSSILLPSDRTETLRVVDLGIPRQLFRHSIQPPLPDPVFASPDVRGGAQPRPADDRWAVGAILHYLLTAADPAPRDGDSAAQLPSRFRPLGPFSPYLDGLVGAAMGNLDAGGMERLPDMQHLARALRGLRDLHRLSPQARQTILALRPQADAPAPSAASLAFIETGVGTQAEIPTLLSDELLDSIEALSSAKPGDSLSSSDGLEDPMGDLGQE
jgi:serine/threonine protein kinase